MYLDPINISITSVDISGQRRALQTHTLMKRVVGKYEDARKRCLSCYSFLSSTIGPNEARKKTKRVQTYCKDCPKEPPMCVVCYEGHVQGLI